ncbi:MAG: RNA-binding transcriptional accessory protein [Planctomycetota bacterium]|nr:MAG: RNA-binding transcriptional accessory protein [Planctomycetota bacterium]
MPSTAPPIERLTTVAEQLALPVRSVAATAALLTAGATVPFLARYRKEATGGLDEVQIAAVRDRLEQLAALESRRSAILEALSERGQLDDALRARIERAGSLAELEDIYLPYRPRRRTRAQKARERGLEPLAERLLEQRPDDDPIALAGPFVDPQREVADPEAALSGARDIIAERIAEDAAVRAEMRALYEAQAVLETQLVESERDRPEAQTFRDYFSWSEPARTAPSHRILAARRGEDKGVLTLQVRVDRDEAIGRLVARFVRPDGGGCAEQVRRACRSAFRRLLAPAMETEIRLATKERADAEAIAVFAENLRELLLAPPLGEKRVLAIDPGYRTGCKVVCLGAQGQLLHDTVVHPHGSARGREQAAAVVRALCERFEIEAIAVGNGTAGRETEAFLRGLGLPGRIPIVLVNEAGASIYSASEIAREEFPDKDVTVRGAISIGRRLQDPLAELVKIEPRSIGVGQYQHDVDQRALARALDDVVTWCVNRVGVELNTASVPLLRYVAGLSERLARAIVEHRERSGPFRSRAQLLEVRGLGPKTFEQCAGFLRIRGGAHPLDASAVHPERYALVERMARDVGCAVEALLEQPALRARIRLEAYVDDEVGLPTLRDILAELERPGRDPRERFEPVRFAEGVHTLEDLRPGMRLEGVVTNVTHFGAFVDVGVKQDGLVHVSQLADRFVERPADVVKVGQRVRVTVLEVDRERRRIGLSMRAEPEIPAAGGATASRGGGADRTRTPRRGGSRRAGAAGRGRAKKPAARTRLGDLLQGWGKGG